ncbi:MAG: MoaF-related domain-containing protein [Pseudonocardiaceae bacterium]
MSAILTALVSLVLIPAASAGPDTASVAASAAEGQSYDRGLAGRSFRLTVDNGLVDRLDYSADGRKVTVTVLASGTTGVPVGTKHTLDTFIGKVGHSCYLVSWIEPSGATSSSTQNLLTGTVQLFFSYQGGDGVRHGEQHTGTLHSMP